MITLKVKQERLGPVIGRHPWVFSQALVYIPDGIRPGEPVRLVTEHGAFLALGYFGSYSQIAVRLWGYDDGESVDASFFRRRIERALKIRLQYLEGPGTDAYRLINGENDLLPGLIVDKYAKWLVVQFHTAGIDAWRKEIIMALSEVVRPEGIFERSDLAVRRIDQMEETEGLLAGTVPDLVTVKENGFTFLVDVKQGQKTGFFLDQRDKRQALMRYVRDASVLNCFAYTGGFTVYALAGGAKRVVSVDTSRQALDLARENVRINGLDQSRCEFHGDDVKAFLKNLSEKFDVIVLDPPAFIKDRRKKQEGIRGYRSINEGALRALAGEGILLTCSCSAHLTAEEFRYLLSEAGGKAGRSLRVLETYTHGIDHPQLVPFTEGSYLKCLIVTG